MAVQLRPAQAGDQQTIERMVHEERLNPMDLNWSNFIIAEDDQEIVGIGQVKSHGDGSRELASLVVAPHRRREGIGGTLMRALMEREHGPLYLMTRDALESYYNRFGFRTIDRTEMPPFFKRIDRLMGVAMKLAQRQVRLVVMKRND